MQARLTHALEQAQKLDARRQAQIANQIGTINRLLKDGQYSEEMKTLHEAAAVLQVENAELRERVKELEDQSGTTQSREVLRETLESLVAAVDALPDSRAQGDREAALKLITALSAARQLLTGPA